MSERNTQRWPQTFPEQFADARQRVESKDTDLAALMQDLNRMAVGQLSLTIDNSSIVRRRKEARN